MTQRLSAIFGRFKTEQLRSAQGGNGNALLQRSRLSERSRPDRQAQLSSLLAKVKIDSAQNYEQEIDQVRAVYDLSETEREIVREIFCLGFDAAEKEHREDKMWAYQRLLRRLFLHQPLDQPIPVDERSREIPGEVTGNIAESSSTQQPPKRWGAPRSLRVIPGRWWLLRYALYSIGAAAFIWTAFAYRSSTADRDAVPQADDRRQTAARASAAQEDRFEPVAHAGALTPPAAIEPVAERASANMAEPAPIRNAIVDQVATSSKSPATAKLDSLAQPGKTKSPAKVANQATTIDAARGENREREPARDSLPIYQTGRRILLREEPRFGAPSQIMLDAGARLIVLDIDGKWLKVKMENTGSPGFVREEFVVPTGAVAPSGASKDQSPP